MKIKLLYYSPIKPIAIAAAQPYNSKPTAELVSKIFKTGHRSIVRHSMAAFLVSDVSQSLLRHISRHPHINLTVESARYCNMGRKPCVIPPFLKGQDMQEYLGDYNKIIKIYNKWNKREKYSQKEQKEISKMFLPLSSTVNLVVSGNYQALYEFLQLRSCARAEWEIRNLAKRMIRILKEKIPVAFKELGCKGDELGYCPEIYGSCGKHPLKNKRK